MNLKIRYQRSGGITGLVRGCALDQSALGLVGTRLVMRLVNTALLAGLKPTKAAKTPGAADLRVHDFVIETDQGTLRWSFDELSLPKPLIPLVALMAKHSKPIRPKN